MPATILAAYDPVTRDRAPLEFAAAVAGVTGASVLVASVYANDDVVDRLLAAQTGEELPRQVGDVLDEAVRELGHSGVDAEAAALGAASPPLALDLAVTELGAHLLVIGSAERETPGHVLAGSTGKRLLNGAPRPVALVPRGWARDGGLDTIGAGLVHTAEGRAAVRSGQALAGRTGGTLRVLTAVEPRSWMVPPGGDAGPELLAELRRRAEDAAEDDADAGGLPGMRIDVDVAVGDPAAHLAGASVDLDLLICGARRYGPQQAVLLGAVTRQITHEAQCPVVVLARGDDAGLEALVS